MGGLVWIVLLGLVAGAIAKMIMPGQINSGWIPTLILGVVGSIVGGFLGQVLGFGDVTGFNVRSLALSVGGACLIIYVYPMLMRMR
jgi:uncharacterized membrane protein YeaQ/YmgE (transglycosylase-associated protein family)